MMIGPPIQVRVHVAPWFNAAACPQLARTHARPLTSFHCIADGSPTLLPCSIGVHARGGMSVVDDKMEVRAAGRPGQLCCSCVSTGLPRTCCPA